MIGIAQTHAWCITQLALAEARMPPIGNRPSGGFPHAIRKWPLYRVVDSGAKRTVPRFKRSFRLMLRVAGRLANRNARQGPGRSCMQHMRALGGLRLLVWTREDKNQQPGSNPANGRFQPG
jgi:hypothetical protein